MSNEKKYWAHLEEGALADAMKKKMDEYDAYLESIGRIERFRKSWEMLNGQVEGANGLRRGGKAGELVKVSVNNYRAFANNIHVLLTQAKSYFECQAENMDFKSQAECVLGKSVVDYYNDEARIGAKFSQSVFSCLGFAEIFMEMDWDEGKGKEFAVGNAQTGAVERGGDITCRTHSTLNVGRDIHQKSAENNRWWVVRDYQDKFELAATYPEQGDWIIEQSAASNDNYRGQQSVYQKIRNPGGDRGDNIEILRLYHDKTRVCPQGIEALAIGGRIIFKRTLDENYGELPLKRFAAADVEGSWLPYSPLWDLIPLCEASDFLTTAAITNAMNFAFTTIWSQDPNLKMEQLTTAMGRVTSTSKPEALNLAQSSPELEKQLRMLHEKCQFLTGINSVASGQPEAVSNIKSGNGLALILSTAVQFQSTTQERFAIFRSECMSLLIKILQKNANLPMLIAIAGKGKVSYAKTFKKEDIKSIRRVKCEVGSPIMATLGGRMQVADNIATKYPGSVSVNAYISVLQTGNLDHIEGKTFNESMAILAENEALSGGKEVPVNILENHPAHIMEHLGPISTPEAKQDPKLIAQHTAHIMAHFFNWNEITQKFPALLAVIGIPPLQGIPPEFAGAGGQQANAPMDGPAPTNEGQSPDAVPGFSQRLPSMPTLPASAPESAHANYEAVNQNPADEMQ